MGGVLSKSSRINQICIFQGRNISDDEENNSDDSSNEQDKWLSDIYQYDQIFTIESNFGHVDFNNNTE